MTKSTTKWSAVLLAVAMATNAGAAPKAIKAGQYEIGRIRQICLKQDGTWYGVDFDFSGQWVNLPPLIRSNAAIFGNYMVQGHEYSGYGNGTLTIHHSGSGLAAAWYDWFDDLSYKYLGDFTFIRLKAKCDPPFTGENTHAASQSE